MGSSVPGGDAFGNNLFCIPGTLLIVGAREKLTLPSWMPSSSEDTDINTTLYKYLIWASKENCLHWEDS